MEDKNLIIQKYKKQHAIFRSICIVVFLAVLGYFLITILKCETFDARAIIACAVFAGSVVIFCLIFTFFDIKRNSIILKYYGKVGEADRNKAKALLEKMNVVDINEYDFYDVLRCDNEDLTIAQIL